MSAVAPGVHFESYIIKELKGITYGVILKSEKVSLQNMRQPHTFPISWKV